MVNQRRKRLRQRKKKSCQGSTDIVQDPQKEYEIRKDELGEGSCVTPVLELCRDCKLHSERGTANERPDRHDEAREEGIEGEASHQEHKEYLKPRNQQTEHQVGVQHLHRPRRVRLVGLDEISDELAELRGGGPGGGRSFVSRR